MEPAWLRLAGVDCGFQSDRPDLGFLGLRHLAAKIQINSYWISLDFLGFPWILSSETSSFNGFRWILAEGNFSRPFASAPEPGNGSSQFWPAERDGLVMGKR
jgi:hypothetical protein